MSESEIWEALKRLNALADTGLIYTNSDYDRERYEEIKSITTALMQNTVTAGWPAIEKLFATPIDYPTAKVDVRAFVLSDNRQQVLLAREKADGRWSLPGGWADVGYSATENAVKECQEETGIAVEAIRLLAVFDKRKHLHPPEAFYVYKLIIYCKALTSEIKKGFDVLDAGYFPVKDLPPLSEDRILRSQIDSLYALVMSGEERVLLD